MTRYVRGRKKKRKKNHQADPLLPQIKPKEDQSQGCDFYERDNKMLLTLTCCARVTRVTPCLKYKRSKSSAARQRRHRLPLCRPSPSAISLVFPSAHKSLMSTHSFFPDTSEVSPSAGALAHAVAPARRILSYCWFIAATGCQ